MSTMIRAAGAAAMVAAMAGGAAAGAAFADPSGTPTGTKPQPAFTLPTPISDHLIVTNSGMAVGHALKPLLVTCPTGYVVTGGGESNQAAHWILLTDSYPLQLSGKEGWYIVVWNSGTNDAEVTVYAVCQKVPT